MTHKARDLSSDQRILIENLIGRPVSEDEAISISATSPSSQPQWLQKSWESAKQSGVDQISMEEIDAEIASARLERRDALQYAK